jgi:hypothetical protein
MLFASQFKQINYLLQRSQQPPVKLTPTNALMLIAMMLLLLP